MVEVSAEQVWEGIKKIWSSPLTIVAWSLVWLILLCIFFVRISIDSQKEQRDAFLKAMDTKDTKTNQTLDRMTDALNKNTEVMIELKTRLK